MLKERMAAIVIGGLMLFSVGGYALMGLGRFGDSGNQQVEIPTIINEYLTSEEVVSILRSGKVLIRDVYTNDCMDCMARDSTLEIFANSFKGFVVLEEAIIEPDNYTTVDDEGYVKFEMVSPTGDIQDLHEIELTQEGLTEIFCEISVVKPRSCLLMEISRQKPPVFESSGAAEPESGLNETGLNESAGNVTMNESIGNANATTNETGNASS